MGILRRGLVGLGPLPRAALPPDTAVTAWPASYEDPGHTTARDHWPP
jgi:hypothetical protein